MCEPAEIFGGTATYRRQKSYFVAVPQLAPALRNFLINRSYERSGNLVEAWEASLTIIPKIAQTFSFCDLPPFFGHAGQVTRDAEEQNIYAPTIVYTSQAPKAEPKRRRGSIVIGAGKRMTQVLLAGTDWHARTLLRAQLIEEGVDVEAHETVKSAIASLETSEQLPSLFIAEISESDDPASDLEALTKWAPYIPVWVIASHSTMAGKILEGRGFERVLFRPVYVGGLVGEIRRLVKS